MPYHVELAQLGQCGAVRRTVPSGDDVVERAIGHVARPGRLDAKSKGVWSSLYMKALYIPVGQGVRFMVERSGLDCASMGRIILASGPAHKPRPDRRFPRESAFRSRQ